MRHHVHALIALAALLGMTVGTAGAEDDTQLEEMVVTGQIIVTPTKQTNETVYTGSEITREGIEIQGGKAETSVYGALSVMPGVNVESTDPYGLSAEQNYIRTRGIRGNFGAMTVEGVPNWGGNPMGPREYIYDMENFQSIAVYKGAIPADLGTGVGARGGAVELRPLWPEEEPGLDVSQGFGSNDYFRTFARIDSGALPNIDTRLSFSYSYTEADKWKGPGDLGPRQNVNLMAAQPVWGEDEIKLFVNHNDTSGYLYRPLAYAEIQSLSENYRKDYNGELTGDRLEDIKYYEYNRGEYTNTDVLAIIPVTIGDIATLSFKPYYSTEDANIFQGVASRGGLIQERVRDIDRYGIISEIGHSFPFADATLGYLFESTDMSISTKNYVPGTFAFAGYGIYTENDDNGHVHSPYLKLSGKIDELNWQAGLKYFHYREPASKGFTSSSPTFELVRAPDFDRNAKEYDAILPTVGLSYALSDAVEGYASYGRSQIRPYSYVPLINLYSQNRSKFQAAGVTLSELFDGYDMEISDNFEVGTRLKFGWAELTPSIYFFKSQNLLVTVYDPRVDLSYQQNKGDATGYGFEIESNVFINDYLTLFVNPSYTSLTYDDDLTYQGESFDTKGEQVVDTPKWMVKSGLIFRYDGFEVVPMVHYIGDRWGDVRHSEKVDDYFVADMKVSYTERNLSFTEALTGSLELYNIFDKEYVSIINAADDTRSGNSSYYVGAPFTVLFKLSVSL